MKPIKKILIANRGEIALRIQRTAKEMQLSTVAVYAAPDAHAAFVRQAGQAILLEGDRLADTYLNIPKIIDAALQTHADAIHPGYGFLSENEKFIEACEQAGLIFIGPSAAAVGLMGHKIRAREAATKAGVPVPPGLTGSPEELMEQHRAIGFPLLIKAAAGGGGKGMQIVQTTAALRDALEATAREAERYFGDGTIYMEKYIETPRHIEVQLLGDQQGNLIHLFERECTLQRRHQKIIEEAPAPGLDPSLRAAICNAALDLGRSMGYYSAGTMEFLLDPDDNFYFLEMNTRIQVEHPVTELTTGIDIVAWQIRIAGGKGLSLQPTDIRQQGHAIECRIYAEDPGQQFLPAPGIIEFYQEPLLSPQMDAIPAPQEDRVRLDGMALKSGDRISPDYDPMIAKLIVKAGTREAARTLALQALEQYLITGIRTNISFLHGLLQQPEFIENRMHTRMLDENTAAIMDRILAPVSPEIRRMILAAGLLVSLRPPPESSSIWQQIGFHLQPHSLELLLDEEPYHLRLDHYDAAQFTGSIDGVELQLRLEQQQGVHYRLHQGDQSWPLMIHSRHPAHCWIQFQARLFELRRPDVLDPDAHYEAATTGAETAGRITAPMPGKVVRVAVTEGQEVRQGQLLLIVEAMKMENNILSPIDARVESLRVKEQQQVTNTELLIQLCPAEAQH
ncbi:acetyl/propionyl/methylcrotonyl-CoA carboxylase subunit alpha [Niabella terrae]